MLHFRRLNPEATLPSYGSDQAAGLDIFPLDSFIISPNSKLVVPTGLAVDLTTIGEPIYGRIAPRSGLAFHHAIDVLAGVIDMDYRGEIHVILFNHSSATVNIPKSKAIAQLVVEKISRPTPVFEETLTSSERGDGRFGSTS